MPNRRVAEMRDKKGNCTFIFVIVFPYVRFGVQSLKTTLFECLNEIAQLTQIHAMFHIFFDRQKNNTTQQNIQICTDKL